MEIINSPDLLWTSDDEANWNNFLLTASGKRLLPKMMENAPGLLAEGHVNKILIRNGELRGFQQAVAALLLLTHSAPALPETQTEYPRLDDDSKWPKPEVAEFVETPQPTPTVETTAGELPTPE